MGSNNAPTNRRPFLVRPTKWAGCQYRPITGKQAKELNASVALLELLLTHLKIVVNLTSQLCDLHVKRVVFLVVKLWLESLSLRFLQVKQLMIDFDENFFELLRSVHPERWQLRHLALVDLSAVASSLEFKAR